MASQPEAPANDPARPAVRIRAGELHLMATEAEAALISAKAPLYNRGGSIVRPVVDDVAASHGRRTKVARLLPVDTAMMVDHMSRTTDFLKFYVRKNQWVAADPPRDVASTILSRDGEWNFPLLAGVITAPTIRTDGTILLRPGYDPQTRLLLRDPPSMPPIPETPTRDHAMKALALLDRLLDGFPFVDEGSRSVALSALITPVVRGAMPVAPMHASSAPVAGSGKSYLFDLASAILAGDRAPVISAGKDEAETEKRLGAALLAGQPIVSIDNVNGELGGDALCQMIERPVVAVRPLGLSKLVRIESRASTFATGNNIRLAGDMTRRALLCSLDPHVERPELREFDTKPFDMIIANRGLYIASALIIVRAYVLAEFPGRLPALASFEEWSDYVRSALVWLGRADPCDTMEAARAGDPVLASLGAVLTAWHSALGSLSRKTGQVIEAAEMRNPANQTLVNVDLSDALLEVAERGGRIQSQRLGNFLARNKGRIVDGLRLDSIYDEHLKQMVWRVIRT